MKKPESSGRSGQRKKVPTSTQQIEVAPREFIEVQLPPADPAARRRSRSPLGDGGRSVPTTFGGYLAGLRRERGLSLRDAAAEIGFSHAYLSQIETGERLPRPSISLMQRIATAFGVNTADVFAAAGLRPDVEMDRTTIIDRAFRALVCHPALAPQGMDAKFWLDSFSTRQKLQWIEFAQNLTLWDEPPEPSPADEALLEVLERFPVPDPNK